MSEDGYYYLHTNGDMIWKRFQPESDSPFVRHIWPVDVSDRGNAWIIILEALALGAQKERVRELATKWRCNLTDLPKALIRLVETPTRKNGLYEFLRTVGGVDPDEWFDWLAATPKGAAPDWATMPGRMVEEEGK